MDSIKYKYKKLSPMKVKKINKNIDNYFIKIDDNWFNLQDIHKTIQKSKINPITNTDFSLENIKKINKTYKNLLIVEPIEEIDDNKSLLNDYIELFESQIGDLNDKQEEMYAAIQNHQNEIEKLKEK